MRHYVTLSVLAAALLVGCSSSNNSSKNQIRDLQATIAALQAKASQAAAPAPPMAASAAVTPSPSPSPSPSLSPTPTPSPTLRPTQSPSPSPSPSPTPMSPAVGTRENPVPKGTPVNLGDGWQVKVTSVDANATQQVLQRNSFNKSPTEGQQFFIATLQATFNGQSSAKFDGGFRMRAVGAAAVSYSTFDNPCGVIPNEIADAETFTGGTITGNLCWAIRSSDADSLVMYDTGAGFSTPAKRIYLSLH